MKKSLLIAIIFLLGGCSTKFTYNNLDWMVHWYIDDYVSLSDNQEAVFDEYFANWQNWHRNEELEKYTAHLKALKADLERDQLTAAQIEKHLTDSRQHWERVRDHVSPELARLALELTDKQVDSLFAELAEENDEIRESIEKFSEKSAAEQLEQRLDDAEDSVSDFIGRLNDDQVTIIERYVGEFGSTRKLWLKYREEFQQAARTMIDGRASNPNFVVDFVALMTHPDKFRSEAYVQLQQQNTKVYSRMAEELFYTLNNKQKRKLISKIDDMIDDFEYLMSND
ncbi:DUF6279 family lipoprotein [Alteromonas lipolytica]|uniref:Lipoprotein n=1 Tax=Alteromonas lipolytica TaxID=1856405 RepID=A0A1E8FGN4_9ALTE|nr:DUF6279 family lipoprotein [Alteromonas lipolytica]OFI35117.1 hypothetical protein BFC17_16350 [Alteromonas lipolytica]GGF56828.1 hypothetical protein GCM10011338_06370 [Alteromonas lipolytica]